MGLLQWEGAWQAMRLVFCNFLSAEVQIFPTIELEDLSYGSEGKEIII